MIILLSLLYAFLSSGGYLDSFGGLGNFTGSLGNFTGGLGNFTGSFGNFTGFFGFLNSDSTTPPPITLKPIATKKVLQLQNKTNSKRINLRHFKDGYLLTGNPIKTSSSIKKKKPTSRSRRRNKIITKSPVFTRSSTNGPSLFKSTTTKTPVAFITDIEPKINVTSDELEVIELVSTTDTVPKINVTSDELEVIELDDENLMQLEAAIDTTTDIPLQSTYVTKYVDKCPEEGYFFKKDYQNGSPTVCYLCFCNDNSTALCWPRNNRKCDAESYQHNWVKKRVSRNKRSPLSFGNLFMADAARDALNSNGKKQCKPHEASYSEGCPPVDWCVGCTVCDCNNNGKWDCHLLSFCSDDDKKKDKNRKGEHTTRPYDPFTVPKTRRADRKLAQQAVQKLAEKMAQDRQKKKIGKNNSRRYFFKNGTLVNKTIFDMRKRKKSATIVEAGAEVVAKWNDVNMKIRKIPDNIQKQMMLDSQNKNAKKVSESANFVVRNMPNEKAKKKLEKSHAEAVSVLAKREPLRKKKRQIILPSGVKLPKEILAKLPNGIIPPSRDPPGEHFPKASHVKRVLTNQMAATKPPRKELAENELPEPIDLHADKSKKVLVKRSTLENEKSHKNVKPPKSSKSETNLRNDKAATKGSKIINKKFTGLKEKSKQRSMQNTNTKITDKRHLKINKNSHVTSKNYEKMNTKAYKNNKISYRNNRSKRANITKKLNKHSSKRRSLKNNYPKSDTNSKKNKIIKRKIASKSSPKNTKQNNKKPEFIVKHKNNTKKRMTSKDDKNITNKKPLNKLSKPSRSKNITQTKETPRNKRSNKENWSKTVKEGKIIKKIMPKNEPKKSNTKKRSTKPNKPQIDRKQLDAQVKKMSENIQANFNRKILDAVGRMIGHNLTKTTKKVKRSLISNQEIKSEPTPDDFISEKSVDLPTKISIAPNFGNAGNLLEKEFQKNHIRSDTVEEKLNLSHKLFEDSEQKMKNQKLDDDIYVATAYHNTATYSTTKIIELLQSKNETLNESSTALYASKKVVNSGPVYRHKRGVNEELSIIRNLEDVENEMSSNALQDISHITTQDKFGTQDSILKYYKYAVDDDNSIKSTDKNHFNEIVEVFTKNAAAKRSVDKQIQSSPGFDVLQITPGLSNNETIYEQERFNKNSNFILPNNNKTITENENLEVNAAEINIRKSTNVLDDRVVIIEDHNASSIEHLEKFITPIPTLNTKVDLKSNLVNITVIGVKKQDNVPTEKSANETHTTKLNKVIEVNYGTMVDKSVVIINDQNNSTSKTLTSNSDLSILTKHNRTLKNETAINTDKKPLPKLPSGKIISSRKPDTTAITSKSLSETNTISYGTDVSILINNTEQNLPNEDATNNTERNFDDNIVIIRENEFQPEKTLHELNYVQSTNVLELTTENYKKSQYKIDKNVTNEGIASSENEVKDIETTKKTLTKMTTEKIKDVFTSSTKADTNEYLTYEIATKSPYLTLNSTMFKKLKKYKKAKNKQKNVNATERVKSKLNINNRFKQNKEKQMEAQENSIMRSNASFLAVDPELKTHISLNITNSNINKTESSTLKDKIQNFSTLIFNDAYSNLMSQPTEKFFISDNSNYTEHKNKLKSNEIKKVNIKKIKKHKLKKILTTLYNRKNKDERQLVENNFQIKNSVNKVNDMKNFFKKLMSKFKFNKHSRKPSNNKKFQILKYLQKFFKQIFANNGTNINNKTLTAKANRKHIIETLCKTFGPCNTNIKNKAKLQSQLDHLNAETYKMLRSVKIIKGLLKLVDIKRNDKNKTLKTLFKSDVQKLHEILRDQYSNEERLGNLTETQKTQIQYIKNNTQYFIQSAARFTMVLNEIINVITETNSNKVENSIETRSEKDDTKLLKTRSMNKTVAMESHESLVQLKELISKYSLIQNTFMRKMYNILTDLGSKENTQNKINIPSSTPAIKSNVQHKTEEIQVYTKNIIENLRKLKNLAQHLNGNVRRKRELRDDESFEYMLMLMEYLLKQQKPLDSAPVNDGIDLLLEAIKSAPDIKLIQKKVLPIYNNSKVIKHLPSYRVRPTEISTETNRSKESSESNSLSDSKYSKEDNMTSSNSDEPKNNIVNNFFDDDADEEDYYTFNRRAQPTSIVEISTTPRKELTTRVLELVTESHYKKTSAVKEKTKPKGYIANSNEDLFNRFAEDEAITSTNVVPEFDYTSGGTVETSTKREIITPTVVNSTPKMQSRYNKVEEDVSASKSRLDWLDETYEEEIKAETRRYSSTTDKPSKPTEPITEKHTMSKQAKKSTYISRFAKVVNDLSSKATTKEIMYKKEMDLLNSLDYANGKVDADVSSSRESGAIDKYSGDAFAAYVS